MKIRRQSDETLYGYLNKCVHPCGAVSPVASYLWLGNDCAGCVRSDVGKCCGRCGSGRISHYALSRDEELRKENKRGSGSPLLIVKTVTGSPFHICFGLAFITSYDYHVTMLSVRIADLKSRLSEHLRKVRAGRSMTVFDRDTPIARIVPYETNGSSLTIRSPLPGSPKLQRVSLPPPLRLPKDIVEFLMEERQGER